MSLIKICVALAFVATLAYATPLSETKTDLSLEENIARYIQNEEVSFELPYVGSTVTLGARNLEQDELDLKVKLSSPAEARKSSKLKKVFAPILILVILKAITLIPLALGILSLKTWNALQLSFVTFVISIALAVFQLCKKVALDHAHPVVTHTPWNAARAMPDAGAQELAYSAYVN